MSAIKCPKCDSFINSFQLKNDNCWSCGEDISTLKSDSKNNEIIKNSINKVEDESAKTNSKGTLSKKYKALGFYKSLAFLLMFFSTALTIHSISKMSKMSINGSMELPVLTMAVTYAVGMVSLYCLIKMIDFLFDLDKNKSDK